MDVGNHKLRDENPETSKCVGEWQMGRSRVEEPCSVWEHKFAEKALVMEDAQCHVAEGEAKVKELARRLVKSCELH